jgi:MraZ protein
MLIGKFTHSIDPKNRIYIPTKFKDDLGSKLVLSQDLADKCLNLYPIKGWEKYANEMDEILPKIKMRRIRQKIFQNADEVEMDMQGRIILNQDICKTVGIAGEKEVVITGDFSHIQIWSIEAWTQFEEKQMSDENQEKIINDLEEMGL